MRVLIILLLFIARFSGSALAETPQNWATIRLEKAMDDYKAGDYRAASKGFKRLANHGSAIAETMLGVMYADGKGMRPQADVAAGYFYRAASRGYGPAQIALSDTYLTGRGVPTNDVEAYFWALASTMGDNRETEVQGHARTRRLRPSLTAAQIAAVEVRMHGWRPWPARR